MTENTMAFSLELNELKAKAAALDRVQAIIEFDPSGIILTANANYLRLMGYTLDEIQGKHHRLFVSGEHAHSAEYNSFWKILNRGEFHSDEYKRINKNGNEVWLKASYNPIVDEEGVTYKIVKFAIDISEKKRALEALELSNIELLQFAYVASHDLQSPLRTISGFAQFLQRDYHDQLSEKANSYINRIVNSALRMQTLIKDLLEFSRIESKSKPFVKVNLNVVFEDALVMLGITEDSEVQVTRDNLPEVVGDRSQLMQLLMNLIGNGLKYHGESTPKVHVSFRQTEEEWIICVEDNGIGIEAKHHDAIFDIFRRLHSNPECPGTGIGLALCRRIIHRHGGRIWLESQLGEGSSFFCSLKKFRLTSVHPETTVSG